MLPKYYMEMVNGKIMNQSCTFSKKVVAKSGSIKEKMKQYTSTQRSLLFTAKTKTNALHFTIHAGSLKRKLGNSL